MSSSRCGGSWNDPFFTVDVYPQSLGIRITSQHPRTFVEIYLGLQVVSIMMSRLLPVFTSLRVEEGDEQSNLAQ